MPSSSQENTADVRTEYRLITEYEPGRFSLRARGELSDVMQQHERDGSDPRIAGKRQGIELSVISTVTFPVQWLDRQLRHERSADRTITRQENDLIMAETRTPWQKLAGWLTDEIRKHALLELTGDETAIARTDTLRSVQAQMTGISTSGGTGDDTPAWLAFTGVPLEDIPEDLRDEVRAHREEYAD